MSSTPEGSYIRGGGGIAIDGHRLRQILLGLLAITLVAFTIIFGIVAVDRNSRVAALTKHGVSVEATVTGCLGMASGTGITEVGYGCTGSFTFQGHTYNRPIHGTAELFDIGQKVPAVAIGETPTVVYTAAAVARMHSTWTVWIVPVVLGLLLLGVIESLRRSRRPNGV